MERVTMFYNKALVGSCNIKSEEKIQCHHVVITCMYSRACHKDTVNLKHLTSIIYFLSNLCY